MTISINRATKLISMKTALSTIMITITKTMRTRMLITGMTIMKATITMITTMTVQNKELCRYV